MTSPADPLKGTTKGPWIADQNGIHVSSPEYGDIAATFQGRPADARLIAAAPDLAARLEEAESIIQGFVAHDCELPNAPCCFTTAELERRAEALLSRSSLATGTGSSGAEAKTRPALSKRSSKAGSAVDEGGEGASASGDGESSAYRQPGGSGALPSGSEDTLPPLPKVESRKELKEARGK